MKNTLTIYCDGGARGNPGPAAAAFVVLLNGKIIYKNAFYLGKSTNNVAEYNAVILALKWILKISNIKYQVSSITFVLDSELIAKQITGVYKTKNNNLIKLLSKVRFLQEKIKKNINYLHVAREKNRLADFLVNQKLDSIA